MLEQRQSSSLEGRSTRTEEGLIQSEDAMVGALRRNLGTGSSLGLRNLGMGSSLGSGDWMKPGPAK